MKKALLLFLLTFLSCHSDKSHKTRIEIMSYNYDIENSERFVDPYFYASIDESGLSKIVQELDSSKGIHYSSKIDQILLKQIINKTLRKDESYFKINFDSLPVGCFLGPNIRIKIIHENGKEVSISFRDKTYKKDSKYYLFGTLYNDLINSPKIDVLQKQEINLLEKNRNDYKKFVYHRDTLDLPMPPPPPPMPKIDEVKFLKK